MLKASPSPRLDGAGSVTTGTVFINHRSQPTVGRRVGAGISIGSGSGGAGSGSSRGLGSPIVRAHSAHVCSDLSQSTSGTSSSTQTATTPTRTSPRCSPTGARSYSPLAQRSAAVRSRGTQTSPNHLGRTDEKQLRFPSTVPRVQMVDAHTQYSPPQHPLEVARPHSNPISHIEKLKIHSTPTPSVQPDPPAATGATTSQTASASSLPFTAPTAVADARMPAAPPGAIISTTPAKVERQREKDTAYLKDQTPSSSSSSTKRNHSIAGADSDQARQSSKDDTNSSTRSTIEPPRSPTPSRSSSKKMRPEDPEVKSMPTNYSLASTRDLVLLISSMLMDLIRYNDTIPLHNNQLTRFHSRAPPGISVVDYLQRLTTHATLSPPILLSMVFYIDKLCALYPAFTISSLTVHRFLITAATVASKGLSDSFWTNKTYAKVGGVSVKELALLELEFLVRVQWRIVPQPEVLIDYYKSLVQRTSGYALEDGEQDHANDDTTEANGQSKDPV